MVSENRLISAILIQAVADWERHDQRSEVQAFLRSQWFVELTEAIELDAAIIRDRLSNGKVSGSAIRAAYRKRHGDG